MFKANLELAPDTFPVLVFSDHVEKYGKKFSQHHLERAFSQKIDIGGLSPPLSYYPFSVEDHTHEIAAYVLRAIMSLAHTGDVPKAEQLLDKILCKVHPMYDLMSSRHKDDLKKKIGRIVGELAHDYPAVKACLDGQQMAPAARANFADACQTILSNMQSTRRLYDFE